MKRLSDETDAMHFPYDINPAGTPVRPSRQLPVLLHRTREALAVHFRKVFIVHNLTDPQWRVLRILSVSGQIDVATLAQRSYLMGPSLSRILRDLGARGLIVRQTSATDARRFFHALTPRGRQLLEKVSPAFNPIYKDIEKRFAAERIAQLNDLLEEFLHAVAFAPEEAAAERSRPKQRKPRSRT